MNKSLGTNLIAFLIVIIGYFTQNTIVLTVGLFALSGAVTNWLAVHMLFEKVPFLYGSGVVENRFEQFKTSIHTLIMNQFFTKENLDKFFTSEMQSNKKLDDTNIHVTNNQFRLLRSAEDPENDENAANRSVVVCQNLNQYMQNTGTAGITWQ